MEPTDSVYGVAADISTPCLVIDENKIFKSIPLDYWIPDLI
ncbi:hypothetical protein [uncultured Desulfobacter sp.]|nr:hypothetical protein [uncultured Desulfobacter sp.]